MMAMPLVAILSANAINSIFRRNTKVFLVVLIISIILPSYVILRQARKKSVMFYLLLAEKIMFMMGTIYLMYLEKILISSGAL